LKLIYIDNTHFTPTNITQLLKILFNYILSRCFKTNTEGKSSILDC
jgi:hypothetical protein